MPTKHCEPTGRCNVVASPDCCTVKGQWVDRLICGISDAGEIYIKEKTYSAENKLCLFYLQNAACRNGWLFNGKNFQHKRRYELNSYTRKQENFSPIVVPSLKRFFSCDLGYMKWRSPCYLKKAAFVAVYEFHPVFVLTPYNVVHVNGFGNWN